MKIKILFATSLTLVLSRGLEESSLGHGKLYIRDQDTLLCYDVKARDT